MVQEHLAFIEWEIDARTNLPDEAREIPLPNMSDPALSTNEYLQNALPMIPKYDRDIVVSAMGMSTSGNVAVHEYLLMVNNLGTPATQEYSTHHIQKYQQLHQTYRRPDQIRELLRNLNNPKLTNRFERARQAHAASKSGATYRTAAANEIRILLEGMKGELWGRARRQPSENMTWGTMSARLAKGGASPPAYNELLAQEAVFSSLFQALSIITKDREGSFPTNLDGVWTRVIDHLYVVLTLVAI